MLKNVENVLWDYTGLQKQMSYGYVMKSKLKFKIFKRFWGSDPFLLGILLPSDIVILLIKNIYS